MATTDDGSSTQQAIALAAQDLTVHAGGQPLLHGIHVQLPAHQWTAIVGPNGAGKSTLLRALAGLQPRKAWQGQIQILGQALHAWPAKARAQALSWMGQNEAVAQDLSSYDVVMLGRMPHQAWLAAPSAHDHAVVQACLHTTQAWAWPAGPLGFYAS